MKRWMRKNSLYFWFFLILIAIGVILGIIASVLIPGDTADESKDEPKQEQYTLGVVMLSPETETEEPTQNEDSTIFVPEDLLSDGLL